MEFIGEIFAFFLLLTFYTIGALSLWSTAQKEGNITDTQLGKGNWLLILAASVALAVSVGEGGSFCQ